MKAYSLLIILSFSLLFSKAFVFQKHHAKIFRINNSETILSTQDVVHESSGGGKLVTELSTLQTAVNQYKRLFQTGDEYDSMGRRQRLARIISSWVFLIIAKSIALASPLYFKALIEKGATADKELASLGVVGYSLQYSAMGLILGYGAMKLASGFVQYVGEIMLSAASTQVSEVLPRQAFASALLAASRRQDDQVESDTEQTSTKSHATAKVSDGKSGFARRALDRGLRASNQLLYRSIFNLLPAFVESFCVLILIIKSTNRLVGLTAAAVISTFVLVTSYIMSYRVRYHRRQLEAENVANGYAEDALSLAEVVASFGAMNIERQRYATALRNVSKASVKVRRSFSALKLIQAAIMGAGSAALMLAAWKSHQSTVGSSKSIAGTLVLTQALFAQMCAPLDHVGQHFRDCVAAAEDLRDLERIVASNKGSITIEESGMGEEIKSLKVQSPYILEVSHLTYSYANSEKQMLSDISLSIPYGGYSVGIVGPSGSGFMHMCAI